ncbi:PREDICTED: IQ domain-containing protein C [Elephantulus edwardii]|uniref:IQ domain-containing protein C n=1 Tax=Elephantulus edwardii TaxID=28737 RepID=UPI0003F06BCB|nr:PREDICTED: IQ domain-containing protein C [Elephantulus edwardii]
MERKELLLKVSVLQACVRGFLVRRQFQNLRAEYESTVREIEGDLSVVKWSQGCIARPQFLPKNVKSHQTWKTGERVSNPKKELGSHLAGRQPKKMMKSGENPANLGRLPYQEDGSGPKAEQSRKTGKLSQGETRDSSRMESPETTNPETTSQLELQEIQHLRSHLAMELLWLQQAINSRKEYLILKKTLSSPEAGQTRDEPIMCPDHVGQACEREHVQPSTPLEDKTTRELDHVDESCQRKARTQLLMCSEEPAVENKSSRRQHCQDLNCQRAGPPESDCSKDHVIWDETLVEPDHSGLGVWRIKLPTGQTLSGGTSNQCWNFQQGHFIQSKELSGESEVKDQMENKDFS